MQSKTPLIRWICLALPDVHRIIFDFHVEIAYQKVKDNVSKLASDEFTGRDGVNSMIFHLMVKIAQDAIDIGKIVYREAHRPQISIYEELVQANKTFSEANYNAWSLPRTAELLNDQLDAYYRLVETHQKLTIN